MWGNDVLLTTSEWAGSLFEGNRRAWFVFLARIPLVKWFPRSLLCVKTVHLRIKHYVIGENVKNCCRYMQESTQDIVSKAFLCHRLSFLMVLMLSRWHLHTSSAVWPRISSPLWCCLISIPPSQRKRPLPFLPVTFQCWHNLLGVCADATQNDIAEPSVPAARWEDQRGGEGGGVEMGLP